MTHQLPNEFYLVIHDFEGRHYGGLMSTEEGPLSLTREAAHTFLSEVLSTWPRTTWQVLHAIKIAKSYSLADVSAGFAEEREAAARERDREINGPFKDPNDEHRLDAVHLGVGIYNTF